MLMSLYGALRAVLGSNKACAHGAYTAVAGDDSAGTVDIDTGLDSIESLNVLILRSDVPVYSDQDVSYSGGTITVADGAATYAITAGDVIHWQAFGE